MTLAATAFEISEPLIDPEALQDAQAVMRDKFPMMVEFFMEDTATYISQIEQALAANSAQAIIPAAHTAKSSCKQMGARRLSSLAKSIEYIARTANSPESLAEIPALLAQMKETFAETKIAFLSLN